MNIGILVTDFPKITETFVLRNIHTYMQKGHDVTVFHLKPYREGEKVHKFANEIIKRGYYQPFLMSFYLLSTFLSVCIKKPHKVISVVKQIFKAGGSDWKFILHNLAVLPKSVAYGLESRRRGITHLHAEFAGIPAASAWMIYKIFGINYSFSCHAHDIFITQKLLKSKVSDADFVRVISEYNREFLLDHVGEHFKEKFQVIRCGADLLSIQESENERQNVFEISYVGSLIERKGVDNLLLALSRIDPTIEWSCRIIGDGSERHDLEALAFELGISEKVDFKGGQTFEEIADSYRRSNLVVVPSIVGPEGRCEGIPVVIMEALAFGCPVIATDVSGIPELIEDGITGFGVKPGDVVGLTQKIEWIEANYAAALEIAKNGKARVHEQYDVMKNSQQLLDAMLASEKVN
ncbi:glycosyltransferase family 4 protein [Neptuniibacter sp. PT8_73]|uniref:glycosyltransferase family 4 protein n=1 Tax=unclassified Neptuniibacter TaxID=2630693 RepID=UPI0039F699AC